MMMTHTAHDTVLGVGQGRFFDEMTSLPLGTHIFKCLTGVYTNSTNTKIDLYISTYAVCCDNNSTGDYRQ